MGVQTVIDWTRSQVTHAGNELLLQVVREVALTTEENNSSFRNFTIVNMFTLL